MTLRLLCFVNCGSQEMEGWRDRGMGGWRDGGIGGWRWRDGGMEGWGDRRMRDGGMDQVPDRASTREAAGQNPGL